MTELEISYAHNRLVRMNNSGHDFYLDNMKRFNMMGEIRDMLIVAIRYDIYHRLIPALRNHLQIPEHLTSKETLTLLQLNV